MSDGPSSLDQSSISLQIDPQRVTVITLALSVLLHVALSIWVVPRRAPVDPPSHESAAALPLVVRLVLPDHPDPATVEAPARTAIPDSRPRNAERRVVGNPARQHSSTTPGVARQPSATPPAVEALHALRSTESDSAPLPDASVDILLPPSPNSSIPVRPLNLSPGAERGLASPTPAQAATAVEPSKWSGRPEPEPAARAIGRALRDDCRTRYGKAGLFAGLALLKEAARDEGCKW
ncbi:hypothetical protein BH09PSE5_BH09PSE5_35430 [soil metagenome]